MFDKVLVANRGEIAVRVIRALRELGISSVAVYSEADRASLHVRRTDQAVAIGPAPASESYLRIDRILEAAQTTGAKAIHPGYGFLSENADFAQVCLDAGLAFVGPSPRAIQHLGEKTVARRLALEAGVPILPGSVSALTTFEAAVAEGDRIGYPVLLKAASGGGGKGMRMVEEAQALAWDRGLMIANHGFTTYVNVAAALHWLNSIPNTLICEFVAEEETNLREQITKQKLRAVDGYLEVPQAPGLGIDLDEDAITRYRVD